MSILEKNKIDFIVNDEENFMFKLIISDHLDWLNQNDHELYLIEKINSYISYIQEERFRIDNPDSYGKAIEIEIRSKYEYSQYGLELLESLKKSLYELGISLCLIMGNG